jgi:hypothetical protein
MSKIEKMARAMAEGSSEPFEKHESLWMTRAAIGLRLIRDDVGGIYPHQVTAWQGIINGILQDAE